MGVREYDNPPREIFQFAKHLFSLFRPAVGGVLLHLRGGRGEDIKADRSPCALEPVGQPREFSPGAALPGLAHLAEPHFQRGDELLDDCPELRVFGRQGRRHRRPGIGRRQVSGFRRRVRGPRVIQGVPDGCDQNGGIDRLGQITRAARREALLGVAPHRVCCQCQDWALEAVRRESFPWPGSRP